MSYLFLLQNIELKNKRLHIFMAYNTVIWCKCALLKNYYRLTHSSPPMPPIRAAEFLHIIIWRFSPFDQYFSSYFTPYPLETTLLPIFIRTTLLELWDHTIFNIFCVWLVSLSLFKLFAMDLGMKSIPIWPQMCGPPTKHTKFWDNSYVVPY